MFEGSSGSIVLVEGKERAHRAYTMEFRYLQRSNEFSNSVSHLCIGRFSGRDIVIVQRGLDFEVKYRRLSLRLANDKYSGEVNGRASRGPLTLWNNHVVILRREEVLYGP
jgi:hypothetical protein